MKRLLHVLCLGIPWMMGCPRSPDPTPAQGQVPDITEAAPTPPPQQTLSTDEAPHHVVFADRTSYAYLLLVKGKQPVPTRDSLKALVRTKLVDHQEELEVDLLLRLIETPTPDDEQVPVPMEQAVESLAHAQGGRSAVRDLLGLHVSVLEVRPAGESPLIADDILADPVLTRHLTDRQRESLPQRDHAILLRAAYRNEHGVRGLRLLQTLARLVAAEQDALIHDWDTGETMGVEPFTERRLQTALGNVADQIVVVPFSDPSHGADKIRLTTRGMRRFGSPDLELDGLPRNPRTLQSATHFLYGLAFQITRQSEVHPSGLAVEADETLTIHYRDVEQAYSSRQAKVPRCADCEESASVHLVERAPRPEDPRGHPVVRVVAPRSRSDRPDYDHPAWVLEAVARVLGP